ncbi:hypothetical protein RAA17_16185 [Komagataeibacter rhaeticus]|nr:hypothetical protein [Komagataeibacter rhaeticus]
MIRMAAISCPARRYCAASSHISGPRPAMTMGAGGTTPLAFSMVWAAPTVMTPGRVQPGMGRGAPWRPRQYHAPRGKAPGLTIHPCHDHMIGRNAPYNGARDDMRAACIRTPDHPVSLAPVVFSQNLTLRKGAVARGAVDLPARMHVFIQNQRQQPGTRRYGRNAQSGGPRPNNDDIMDRIVRQAG